MTRRVSRDPAKRAGRPTALTERTADVILDAVGKGNHLTTACALAHVHPATLHRWIERANAVDRAIEAGAPYDRADLRFRDFRDRLAATRARAEVRAVDVIDRSMQGGFVISEEPVVNDRGEVQRDNDGEVLWKRTYSQPDGRLALSYLGRSRPNEWGQNATQRIELTAPPEPEGGPSGPAPDQIGRLAERLAIVAARRAAEPDEEFGPDEDGVYPAEIVEDRAP